MGIEGSLIVSQHILDDTGLRETLTANENTIRSSADRMAMVLRDPSGRFVKGFQDSGFALRRALGESQREIQTFGGTAVAHFERAGSSAAELTHAGWALRSSLHLVTGETGFLATEILMTSAHMSRLITAAGGATAAVSALGVATKGFLVSIGPVGWAILALGAAYLTYERLTKTDEEVTKAATKEHEHQLTIFEAERKAMVDLAVAQGVITAQDRRRMELHGPAPLGRIENEAIDATMRDEAALAANKQYNAALQDSWEWQEKLNRAEGDRRNAIAERIRLAVDEQHQTEKQKIAEQIAADSRKFFVDQDARAIANRQRAEAGWREELEKRASAVRAAAVNFGGAKPSDFLTGRLRDIALFNESAEARLKAVGEAGTFGITSRASSEFRFGAGAAGSVVGEQNEAKNTTRAVKELTEVIKTEFRAAFGSDLSNADLGLGLN